MDTALFTPEIKQDTPAVFHPAPCSPLVAALFVQPGGCYTSLPWVDAWPESRDARRYDGNLREASATPELFRDTLLALALQANNEWNEKVTRGNA